MSKTNLLSFKISILVILGFTACSNHTTLIYSSDSQDPKDYSKTLYVHPGAKNIIYIKYPEGKDSVTYEIQINYPANIFLSEISTHLNKMSYIPLNENYLFSKESSSIVKGWELYIDKGKKIKHWWAHWKGYDESLIWCDLQYSNPINRKDNNMILDVSISYYTPSAAKEMKDSIYINK